MQFQKIIVYKIPPGGGGGGGSIASSRPKTFNIPYVLLSKGDNFQYFTNLLNSKVILSLFQVLKQFSCVFMQHN